MLLRSHLLSSKKKTQHCDSGGTLEEKNIAINWAQEKKDFRIENVPCLECNDCHERFFSTNVESNITDYENYGDNQFNKLMQEFDKLKNMLGKMQTLVDKNIIPADEALKDIELIREGMDTIRNHFRKRSY